MFKPKKIFYRVKGESKIWSIAFLSAEENGLVEIKTQRDIDLYNDGTLYSKKDVEIKERKYL